MLADALWTYRHILAEDGPSLRKALDTIGRGTDFSVAQAFALSAAVHALKPRIVLDIGTGYGNSAATFAIAGERYGTAVFTFDMTEMWRDRGLRKLERLGPGPWDRVVPVVGDLTGFDFTALAKVGGPILLFWDAHGYAIAEHLLGHLMPMIADRPHLVVCHDIGDNRFSPPEAMEYAGKRFWRGMADFYANPDDTTYGNIGWSSGIVDQIIPILDFCARNDLMLSSADFGFRRELDAAKREEIIRHLPECADVIGMAYFTMNGTSARRFPPPARQFAAALAARADRPPVPLTTI